MIKLIKRDIKNLDDFVFMNLSFKVRRCEKFDQGSPS